LLDLSLAANRSPTISLAVQSPLGFTYARCCCETKTAPNVQRACFRARKALEGLVYDTVALEGNPFTFPEVKTLLDGVTVGGHRLDDHNQVLNQAAAWRALLDAVGNGSFVLSERQACDLHALVAREEALTWGTLRDGEVGIHGTLHTPPPAAELPQRLARGFEAIEQIASVHERAIATFLFGALHQFFWDGNRRTSRLLMNGILLTHGYDVITVPAAERLVFNQGMVAFYDSRDATAMMERMAGWSIDPGLLFHADAPASATSPPAAAAPCLDP